MDSGRPLRLRPNPQQTSFEATLAGFRSPHRATVRRRCGAAKFQAHRFGADALARCPRASPTASPPWPSDRPRRRNKRAAGAVDLGRGAERRRRDTTTRTREEAP